MNNIRYDQPRLVEMQNFLTYIYTITVQNKETPMTHDIVYNELCRYGLSSDELGEKRQMKEFYELFPKWEHHNLDSGDYEKTLRVEHHENMKQFLQFFTVDTYDKFHRDNKFIKLYIPLGAKNLYQNVTNLFDFMTNSNIKHASKVSGRMRCDNVIVRLDSKDIASVKKIINYIYSNKSIKDSLKKTNPFVPCISGIGIMEEPGISYNGRLSELINDYVYKCIGEKKKPDIQDFYSWAMKTSNNKELIEILSCAIDNNTQTVKDDTIVTEKDKTMEVNPVTEKEKLFRDAICATYRKYGMTQVVKGIQAILYLEDYRRITNGDEKYRDRITGYISKEDVQSFLRKELHSNDISLNKKAIELYCYRLFNKEMLETIRKVCLITLEKSDANQVKSAIRHAILEQNYRWFSRHSLDENDQTDYRSIIASFSSKSLLDLMSLSLGMPIVDGKVNDLDNLINLFVNKYIHSSKIDNVNISRRAI